MEKERESEREVENSGTRKYKVLYNIFSADGGRRKTGNPQNQRIDGRYDNALRVLANQLCALFARRAERGKRGANGTHVRCHRRTPFALFSLSLSLSLSLSSLGRAFICPPSFCTSNAISAVNAGCARLRGIIMAARALARLMRSGKIRPSVCARPSDAC